MDPTTPKFVTVTRPATISNDPLPKFVTVSFDEKIKFLDS